MQMLNAQKLETDVSKVRAKLSAGDGHSGLQVTVGKLLIGGLPGLRLTFEGLLQAGFKCTHLSPSTKGNRKC